MALSQSAGGSGHGRLLVVIGLGSMLAPLNSTMIAVALPDLGRELGAGPSQVGWLVVTYLITMALVQPIAGRLGDLGGRQLVAATVSPRFSQSSSTFPAWSLSAFQSRRYFPTSPWPIARPARSVIGQSFSLAPTKTSSTQSCGHYDNHPLLGVSLEGGSLHLLGAPEHLRATLDAAQARGEFRSTELAADLGSAVSVCSNRLKPLLVAGLLNRPARAGRELV